MNVLKTLLYTLVILAVLGIITYIIYSQVREHYLQSDPMLHVIKQRLAPLHEKVQDLNFYEGDKSYTINKKKIHLCLKDEYGDYYDLNMLLYVAIHELAHVLCDEIGHTPKFHRIFQEKLKEAEEMGIYDSSKPIVSNYCGHT